jgi:hypothetical protein
MKELIIDVITMITEIVTFNHRSVANKINNEKIDYLIAYVYGLLAERALKKLEK